MTLDSATAIIASWAGERGYISQVWVFGSRVRGDHRPDSDLDLIIDYNVDHVGSPHDPPNDHDALEAALGWELHFPQSTSTFSHSTVRSAPVAFERGKVVCVRLPRATAATAM